VKIKEILELTQTENIATIAKNRLTIGEKALRDRLKSIGCTNQVGKKGWIFTGENTEILEKSIYEFAQVTATKKPKASNNNNVDTTNKTNNKTIKNNTKYDTIKIVKDESRKEHDMKAEIQALIKGTSKEENNRVYKGIYFDRDIAEFLDNVKHGNKSEIVNMIMRQYLLENELL
jgi:hypothetical protein